jgi:hypothetical protein
MAPLNGKKTHPLKPASLSVLRVLSRKPLKAHLINPGVRDRLTREGLAEEYYQYGTHQGTYYRITDAGRTALINSRTT